MKPRTKNILWIVGFLIVAGLAIGLGVGLTQGKNGSPQPSPPPPPTQFLSTSSRSSERYKEEPHEVKKYPHYCAVVKDKSNYNQDRAFLTCLPAIKGGENNKGHKGMFYTMNELNSENPQPIYFVKKNKREITTYIDEAQKRHTRLGEVGVVYHRFPHEENIAQQGIFDYKDECRQHLDHLKLQNNVVCSQDDFYNGLCDVCAEVINMDQLGYYNFDIIPYAWWGDGCGWDNWCYGSVPWCDHCCDHCPPVPPPPPPPPATIATTATTSTTAGSISNRSNITTRSNINTSTQFTTYISTSTRFPIYTEISTLVPTVTATHFPIYTEISDSNA